MGYTMFAVGQLVGTVPDGIKRDDGLISVGDRAVQIRIDEVSKDLIQATVTALGDFFSQKHQGDRGFVLGEKLKLFPRCKSYQGHYGDDWVVGEPLDRPWHILGVR